jgi:predicted glycosyltransferase
LHPSYFIADDSVFSELGLSLTDEFIIIRLISWKASHDKRSINRSNYNSILRIVKKVLDIGIHVFISSETNLSPELEPFRIKIVPQRLHHVLAFAKLYIGEGGTTATEACILGTPSIIINEQAKHIGIHQQLQNKYKLQFYFDNINDAELKIFEILNNKNSKLIWSERRNIFLENNINPTNYLINFILHKKWQK